MHSPPAIAKTAVIQSINISIGEDTQIMDYCVLGVKNPWSVSEKSQRELRIGKRCIIYPWSILYEGTTIEDDVQIFERSLIGSFSSVGQRSRLLYGAQVHDNVIIGPSSIIGGFVADNCKVGANCFVYGALVHRHENRDLAMWDEIDEIGPTLENKVFIGWGAVVAGNIKIGESATIKPNAVVSKDVAPGETFG